MFRAPRNRTSDGEEVAAYSLTARTLHWSTAALVLTTIPLAVVMVNMAPLVSGWSFSSI
jgi:cytochrome b561